VEEFMEFFKTLIKNRKLAFSLGKNEFKNRFANTGLGAIWGFLSPFIFMLTYVVVFQYILKIGSSGNDPYVVWFLPGMATWMAISDSILSASSSIRSYSYLVKKVVFPVDIIPVISIIANSFVAIFLFAITLIVCTIYGYLPNLLLFVYVVFAIYAFVIAFTRFSSALTTLVPDFSQLLGIVMQLFFWFTPIIWNLQMVSEHPLLQNFMMCTPFTYLVTAMREVFIDGNIVTANHGIYTIVFWAITIILFVWGNHVFKKSKRDFADVL
jgi:ABC-type polysaccharide/polyol phosphate export permease